MSDFAAYPEWNAFIRSISGELQVGARLEVRIEPPGARATTFRRIRSRLSRNSPDALAEQGTRGSPGEQIRISNLDVEGLCGDVLDDDLMQGNMRLSTLYRTLRHYRGEPVP